VVILFNTFINGRQSGQLKHEQTLGFVKEVTLKKNGAIIVVKSLYCDDVT
jgi:hypothetical protein